MPVNYLFDNAVLDRYARIANGLEVETELEFADRLWLLGSIPAGDLHADVQLDTFMDRVRVWSAS